MNGEIIIRGIQTNNLKDISISIEKNALNLILGPSGSGKSSLAYDTVAQIGMHELGAMYYDSVNEPEYKISSYSNMIVTVPIKQLNNNNNVRSTVSTYFSISPCLSKIYSSLLHMPYDYFVLNKSQNICSSCLGIGYNKKLDPYKIVDYDKTIEEVPIRCWKRNKDFYRQILELYCSEMGIPAKTKFRHLSNKQQQMILYGTSKTKYKIKYKVTNHFSTRTTLYYGPMTSVAMLKNFSPSDEFFSESPCEICAGEKFEIGHRKYKLCGYSIGELLLLSFDEILNWTKQLRIEYDCEDLEFSISQIEAFAKKAVELKLGYLSLNRTIPSLSGGELQRLRLIQVFNSQLTDLLIVLDEPLAGLSSTEKKAVYDNIIRLKQKHTLLIIDHQDMFIKEAENIIALGEGGGVNGGEIINAGQYILRQQKPFPFSLPEPDKLRRLSSTNSVYHYRGFDINIADGKLNLILGASGVGKSTLLREYFPQVFDDYLYINQKPFSGNIRSTVSTAIGVSNLITRLFAKQFNQEKTVFSNLAGAKGACKTCGGTGVVVFGSESQSQIILPCKDCRGTGFSNSLLKFTIAQKSIQDILNMTIDEGIVFFSNVDKGILAILQNAQKLLLGHLQIGEKTQKLSGGENIRIKLMTALSSNKQVIGIDEPFKGLNNEEIYTVSLSLNERAKKGKTIIVADHEESAQKYFINRIVLINDNGVLTGKD